MENASSKNSIEEQEETEKEEEEEEYVIEEKKNDELMDEKEQELLKPFISPVNFNSEKEILIYGGFGVVPGDIFQLQNNLNNAMSSEDSDVQTVSTFPCKPYQRKHKPIENISDNKSAPIVVTPCIDLIKSKSSLNMAFNIPESTAASAIATSVAQKLKKYPLSNETNTISSISLDNSFSTSSSAVQTEEVVSLSNVKNIPKIYSCSFFTDPSLESMLPSCFSSSKRSRDNSEETEEESYNEITSFNPSAKISKSSFDSFGRRHFIPRKETLKDLHSNKEAHSVPLVDSIRAKLSSGKKALSSSPELSSSEYKSANSKTPSSSSSSPFFSVRYGHGLTPSNTEVQRSQKEHLERRNRWQDHMQMKREANSMIGSKSNRRFR